MTLKFGNTVKTSHFTIYEIFIHEKYKNFNQR